MTDFDLHATLAADTVEAARWPLCRVLLARESRYPWLVLVPAIAGLTEIHHLGPADQTRLMTEIDRASRALVALHAPDKINVASLGNMVPQLHVHVVARFRSDAAWPGPIWGAHPPVPYAPAEMERTLQSLRQALR